MFIAENKNYAKEIKDMMHDIDLILKQDNGKITETIRAIIVLAQMNTHIWYNETKFVMEKKMENLHLTHGLNSVRNTAGNKIARVGGRRDYKVDCLAAEFKDWEISW